MLRLFMLAGLLSVGLTGPLMGKKVKTVDPTAAIDGDLSKSPPSSSSLPPPPDNGDPDTTASDPADTTTDLGAPQTADTAPPPPTTGPTYKRDDLIGAAEGVFGKGSKGLAELIEKILKKQGEPKAYIAGREAAGAIVFGLR